MVLGAHYGSFFYISTVHINREIRQSLKWYFHLVPFDYGPLAQLI